MGAEWEAANYIIKRTKNSIAVESPSGIPPLDIPSKSVTPKDGEVVLSWKLPNDTIIDSKQICTVAGVQIVRKQGGYPSSQIDGKIIYRGKGTSFTDTGLTNGVSYYYGIFPYSDHGVYNIRSTNVIGAQPAKPKFLTFDQDFTQSDPTKQITYPVDSMNEFADSIIGASSGYPQSSWWSAMGVLSSIFSFEPFMVKSNGEADYRLSHTDYNVKMENTSTYSDLTNPKYNGGAFVWLKEVYIHEEYSTDGNSREVIFAPYKMDGFHKPSCYGGNRGIWIPIGWPTLPPSVTGDSTIKNCSCVLPDAPDTPNRTLTVNNDAVSNYSNQTDYTLRRLAQERASTHTKGKIFGGRIWWLLRDIDYLITKRTYIPYPVPINNFSGTTNYYGGYPPFASYSDYNLYTEKVGGLYYIYNSPIQVQHIGSYNQYGVKFGSIALGKLGVPILDPYYAFINVGGHGGAESWKFEYTDKMDVTSWSPSDVSQYSEEQPGSVSLYGEQKYYPKKLKVYVSPNYGSTFVADTSGSSATYLGSEVSFLRALPGGTLQKKSFPVHRIPWRTCDTTIGNYKISSSSGDYYSTNTTALITIEPPNSVYSPV